MALSSLYSDLEGVVTLGHCVPYRSSEATFPLTQLQMSSRAQQSAAQLPRLLLEAVLRWSNSRAIKSLWGPKMSGPQMTLK